MLGEVAADSRHLRAEIGVLSISTLGGPTFVRRPHIIASWPEVYRPLINGGSGPKHAHFFLPVTVLRRPITAL